MPKKKSPGHEADVEVLVIGAGAAGVAAAFARLKAADRAAWTPVTIDEDTYQGLFYGSPETKKSCVLFSGP
jgi:thioredoxin reductase